LIRDLDPRQLLVDSDMLVRIDISEVIKGAGIKRKLTPALISDR
jgi:hypothetical protein